MSKVNIQMHDTVTIIYDISACGLSRTDLVIILDASTSVTAANFKKQLEFVKTIIDYADIDSGRNRKTKPFILQTHV